MKEIQAIIFDMDGVLIDSERVITLCWLKVAQEMNIEDIDTAIINCVGLNRADTKDYFLLKYGQDFPYTEFNEKVSTVWREMIEKEGLLLKPYAREILSYFSMEKVPIGLASSSRYHSVINHMKNLDLLQYFDIVIGGDMVEHSKPNPEIYVKACEMIGYQPEKCLAIEDSPNGIRAAYDAGMQPVMIPDLLQPSEDIKKLLYRQYETLEDLYTEWRNKE